MTDKRDKKVIKFRTSEEETNRSTGNGSKTDSALCQYTRVWVNHSKTATIAGKSDHTTKGPGIHGFDDIPKVGIPIRSLSFVDHEDGTWKKPPSLVKKPLRASDLIFGAPTGESND